VQSTNNKTLGIRRKITKTCDKASEGSPASAATGVQQGCVGAVIAASYFEVTALNEPECR